MGVALHVEQVVRSGAEQGNKPPMIWSLYLIFLSPLNIIIIIVYYKSSVIIAEHLNSLIGKDKQTYTEMQSAKEKLKNTASAAKEHVDIYKAKLDEKVMFCMLAFKLFHACS